MAVNLRTSSVVVLSLSLCALSGCAGMVETQTIASWAEALEQNNDRKLRAVTTDDFEKKALAEKDSAKTLKQAVNVPVGKTKIIKTTNEGKDAKRVTVEVGQAKDRVVYRLKRDERGSWLVDDVWLSKRDLKNQEPVSAKLNLVLSLQQFLDAWSSDDPQLVRNCSTEEFNTALKDLPPAELSRMTNRLTGDLTSADNLRPRLILREETAECQFTRNNAELTVKFERATSPGAPADELSGNESVPKASASSSVQRAQSPESGRWLVSDVSIDSSRPGEDIASVKHMARVAAAAIAFHRAYSAGNKVELAQICTHRFFDGSLAGADLSVEPLPPLDAGQFKVKTNAQEATGESAQRKVRGSSAGDQGPEIAVDSGTASYLWKTDKEIIRIGLLRDSGNTALPVYHVDDVTIYELDGRQNKRLSALFTAQAVLYLFREALAERDVQQLINNSTLDFNTRVWERLKSPELARHMPFDALPHGEGQVLNMVFEGPLTSITLIVDGRAVCFLLRDEKGRVLVDDVQFANPGFPESLKTTCEALIPAYQFAQMMTSSQINKVRGVASHEFNRLVWNQLPRMPEPTFDLPRHFGTKAQKVHVGASNAMVTLGDSRFGVKFLMVKEKDTFQVDDVVFVTGAEASEAIGLRKHLRTGIQTGAISTSISVE